MIVAIPIQVGVVDIGEDAQVSMVRVSRYEVVESEGCIRQSGYETRYELILPDLQVTNWLHIRIVNLDGISYNIESVVKAECVVPFLSGQ